MEEMRMKLNVTMHVVGNSNQRDGGLELRKVKFPEPQTFDGARDAKELENFLFDMERCIWAMKFNTEEEKVKTQEAPQEVEEEEDDMEEAEAPRMGALGFLNALKRQADNSKKNSIKGLMFVKDNVEGKAACHISLKILRQMHIAKSHSLDLWHGLIVRRRSTMASEEGNVVAVEELQQEQPRGREEQARTQSRRGKSKGPAGESLEPRVASLESHMEGVRTSVGELSDQIENLILENREISRVAKAMIEELGRTFRGELRSLTQDLYDLQKFVGELYNMHAEMDEICHE
ncbi:hypothetical protein L6164_026249 [Bauhinia variegata]|uniref:Uncharacterized protein n=1 Tax=Bauhinia variegata TaxID=167791 RepID=A0ACB9LPT0_BAUVA|nr:hypothetical protein L6164_026249 [Bauhinia variegata]